MSLLQWRKIREVFGIVEKEADSREEEEKGGEDEGIDDVERPSLPFPLLISISRLIILFFHGDLKWLKLGMAMLKSITGIFPVHQ